MVTVKLGTKTEEKPFPKLMRDKDGLIVFFRSVGEGMVIHVGADKRYDTGDYEKYWITSEFTDYNEPVTLQNA